MSDGGRAAVGAGLAGWRAEGAELRLTEKLTVAPGDGLAVGVVHLHGERRRDRGADVGRLLIARDLLELGDRLGDRDARPRHSRSRWWQ